LNTLKTSDIKVVTIIYYAAKYKHVLIRNKDTHVYAMSPH